MSRWLILISVVLAVVVANSHALHAQEATPAASPVALPPVIADWEAAMATYDPDAILALYADDAVWEEVALGLVLQGHEQIRTHLDQLFAATPDITFRVTDGFAAGDHAAAEWMVTGTLTGDFPGLPPGAGQPFAFRGVSLFELVDGTIVHYTEYWDAYAFLVQLGALPAPGTPTP